MIRKTFRSLFGYFKFKSGATGLYILLTALLSGLILPVWAALPILFIGGYISGSMVKKSLLKSISLSSLLVNSDEPSDSELKHIKENIKKYADANNLPYVWLNTYIPEDVDVSLDKFLTVVVDKFIYEWYKDISINRSFLYEVSSCIRIILAVIIHKLRKINLAPFLHSKVIPIALCHLEFFINVKKKNDSKAQVEQDVLKCYGKHKHVVLEDRQCEIRYVESLTRDVIGHVFSSKYTDSRLAISIVKEILARHLVLPLIDLICDPDVINQLLIVLFDKEPMKMYEKDNPRIVLVLDNFVNQYWTGKKDKLESVRQDDELFFLFMKFIKEEGAIDILQLFLALDEFTNKMLQPELNENQKYQIFRGAVDINKMYNQLCCYTGNVFDEEISRQMDYVLHEGPDKITKLQKLPAVYRMHENMYNLLEQVFLPGFYADILFYQHKFGTVKKESVKNTSLKPCSDKTPFQSIGNKLKKIKGALTMGPVDGCLLEDEIAGDLTEEFCLEDECIDSNEDLEPSYRNLNAWRVSIPAVDQRLSCNNKPFFVFIIEVQRIDVQGEDDIDELRWTVERRYHEFYVLENKLIEFHGELTNIKLPMKWFVFGTRGKDFMESRKKLFEQFLQSLLQQPKLKGSNLLFTFLTSLNEFSASFLPDISFGKMIKTVPRKLVKERGQHLENFLVSFMMSTEPVKVKQLVPEVVEEIYPIAYFEVTNEDKPIKQSHTNNFPKLIAPEGQLVRLAGLYDAILYIGVKVFVFPKWLESIYIGIGSTFKMWIDHVFHQKLSWFLDEVFVHQRIERLVTIIEKILFIDPPMIRTEEMKVETAEEALQNLKEFYPSMLSRLMGRNGLEDGTDLIFNMLQYEKLNRQLIYLLLDVILIEMFPDLFNLDTSHIIN